MTTDRDVQRFTEKVAIPRGDKFETACWRWEGARHSKGRGYGKFRFRGRVMNAHKASYLMFTGEVEPGQVVHHKCGYEECVSPYHLEACSQAQNVQYCIAMGRHVSQQ
jgi:hypothetical protein